MGEAAWIVLSTQIGADLLILDDRLAKIHAVQQGLKVTGTVGILMMICEKHHRDLVGMLDNLMATGFRLSPQERLRVLDISKNIVPKFKYPSKDGS
ncbi:MAG: hypothetical protein IT210_22265 [Armatimonadetes bacterium]|nr:hypothetical protein [Armatimonadota bacterium]